MEEFVPAQAPVSAAPRNTQEAVPPEVQSHLERQLEVLSARFAAGHEPASRRLTQRMNPNETRFFSLRVSPGRCYRVLGASQSGVSDVDAVVYDETQTELESDLSYGPQPTLGVRTRLCANRPAVWRVELRMLYSQGWTALQVYATANHGGAVGAMPLYYN